jgi:Dimerisation domain
VSSESPVPRLQALADFAAPWSVAVAATLRLPDHLEEGELTADELAERAGAHPDPLTRLLRYLVVVGVFAEPSAGRFANTELSRLLLDATSTSHTTRKVSIGR